VLTKILFEAPSMYELGLKTGELIRVGGIIKNAATGQIVTHLQESGLGQSLISNLVMGSSPAGMALKVGTDLVGAGANVYTAYQVVQLKAMIESLQVLQVATLGTALVGVGVSAASFIYMRKRFNGIDKKLDELLKAVQVGFDNQQMTVLRAHLSQVSGLVKQAEQASSLSSPASAYARVADALADQSAHFEGEVQHAINAREKINPDFFWQLVQALLVCNSIRIDCRLRTDELRNAMAISVSTAETYEQLFENLTPLSFEGNIDNAARMLAVLKDVTDVAGSKPYLIDFLQSRRIAGPDYLNALEKEERNPIVMLSVL